MTKTEIKTLIEGIAEKSIDTKEISKILEILEALEAASDDPKESREPRVRLPYVNATPIDEAAWAGN